MRNTKVISISIPESVDEWIDRRCKEWKCKKSWFVSQLLYSAMIRSEVLPGEHEKRSEQHKL